MLNIRPLLTTKFLLLGFFLLAPGMDSALASEGMAAFNRKDYNEAYRIWRRSPDAPESKYGMGRLHFEGLGGPQNTAKGVALIDEASRAGYGPATEYLASHYEKRKDFKNAVRYLERMSERTASSSIQKRLVEAYSQTEAKPLSTSTKYCSALKTLVEMESGSDPKMDMRNCALAGKPSTMSREAALKVVGSNLTSSPSIDTLKVVAKELLDRNSPSFNPIAVESAVWAIDPNLNNPAIKSLLLDSGVTYQICLSLPIRTQEGKNAANSYCTLAAISGSELAIKGAASDYAKGTEGRSVDLQKAAALYRLSPTLSVSKEAVLIRLDSLIRERNWKQHLKEMDSLSLQLKELSSQDLTNQFAFQTGSTRDIDYQQSHAATLLRLANLVGKSDIQGAVFDSVKAIPPETREGDSPAFIDALCKTESAVKGAEKECRAEKRQPSSGQNALRSAPSSLDSARPATDPVTGAGTTLPPRGAAAEVAARSQQSVLDCDSGNLKACAVAAKALMSDFPPRGYESMPPEERRRLAIVRLERGATGGDVSSLAALYDLYSADLDSSLRSKAKEYLAILIQKGTPEGRLREQLDVLNVDPLSGILGAVLERAKYKRACTALKLQLQRRELNRDDEVKAAAALDGVMCNAVK